MSDTAAVRRTDDRPAGARPAVLPALTGVRAWAMLAVLVYHSRDFVADILPASRVLRVWTSSGYMGVDVFFVLSGFIISHNYAETFRRFTVRAYGPYLVSRFARIYPVFLVTLLLTAVVVGWLALDGRRLSGLSFLGNVVMLQTMPGVRAWNLPSWSVCCEVGAYLLFPFVAGVLLRLGWRSALALAIGTVAALVGAVHLIFALDGGFPFNAYYWTRLAAEFAIGCLLWVAWRQRFRPHPAWDVVAVVAALAVLLVIRREGLQPAAYVAVGFMGLLIVSVASATGMVRTALASVPFEWLGRMSYSVYLVHYPLYLVLFAAFPVAEFASAALPMRIGLVALCLVVPVIAGAALYYSVEEPARRRIAGRRSGRPPSRGSGDDGSRAEAGPPMSSASL